MFCPQRGPGEGKRGAAHEHPACGCLERRTGCLPEKVRSPGRASEPETGSILVPQPPSSRRRERCPLRPWSHFGATWGWGNASHAIHLYLPFQEPQEAAQMNPVFLGKSQNKPFFFFLTTYFCPLLAGKHGFIQSLSRKEP